MRQKSSAASNRRRDHSPLPTTTEEAEEVEKGSQNDDEDYTEVEIGNPIIDSRHQSRPSPSSFAALPTSNSPLEEIHFPRSSAIKFMTTISETIKKESEDTTWCGCLHRLARGSLYFFIVYLLPLANLFCIGAGTVLVSLDILYRSPDDFADAIARGLGVAFGLSLYYFLFMTLFRWLRSKESNGTTAVFYGAVTFDVMHIIELVASSVVILSIVISCSGENHICHQMWYE